MELQFIDTNLIIRYLTRDHPDQAARAFEVFQEMEKGTLRVTTSEAVIVEVVWVLSSPKLYNVSREDIRKHLTNILSFRGLHLPHKRSYLEAVELYGSIPRLSFVDALNVVHMKRRRISAILSFDTDFDYVSGITRREP